MPCFEKKHWLKQRQGNLKKTNGNKTIDIAIKHIRVEFQSYYVLYKSEYKSEGTHKLSDIASMMPQETVL